jgi:putative photosynthetic complex assembly protein
MSNTTASFLPDKPMAAVFIGLAATVLLIGGARLAGYQAQSARPLVSADEMRELKFEDASRGVVNVSDAKTGERITSFGSGEGAFVRATLRALVNNRRRQGMPIEGDFKLERHGDNQLYLIDEIAGKTLTLNAYGPVNAAAFAAFMPNYKADPNKGESQ